MRKLIIWAIVLLVAFFWGSTVYSTCGDTVESGIDTVSDAGQNVADGVKNTAKDLASLGDEEETGEDGGGEDDSYDIEDENDAVGDNDADLEDDEEDSSGGNIVDDEEEDDEEEEDEEDEEDSASERAVSSYSSGSKGSSDGKYLVVAGNYRHEENAEVMVNRLKKLGYDDAEIFSFDFSEYFSVTTGRYSSDSESKSVADRLESEGIDAYTHKMRSKYFD